MGLREGREINLGEYLVFGRTQVFEHEPLPPHVNLRNLLVRLEDSLPQHYVGELDVIYIGNYDFLAKRDLNAMYENGAIYILPDQDDEDDLYDDMIHEIAHCVEDTYGDYIYGDGEIEREFLVKRKKLLDILKREGYDCSLGDFLNVDYSKEFDEFLYIDVGYPKLQGLTMNLFVSPYGATSLREYFANCFEEVYARENLQLVKSLSPAVYKTISKIS